MKNLSGKDRWSKVYLNDDYTQPQRNQNSDLRAIATLAKSKGFDAKVCANSLWLEGRRYGYDDIARIPQRDINIEKAKIIEVDNGNGIGFQSRHSKFSNLAPCVVKLDDLVFASSEAAFQYLKARDCGTKKQIEDILLVAQGEAYDAKLRSYGINETEEWRLKKTDEMLRILVLKQTIVNNSIWTFNIGLIERYKGRHIYLPRLDRPMHRTSRGLRKNYYHHLTDGLHPNELTSYSWAKEILKAVHNN